MFQVGHTGVRRVIEEAWADVVELWRQHQRCPDEVDAGDRLVAMGAEVVAHDESAVGRGDEHRAIQSGVLDDRRQVIRPQLAIRVTVGVERFLGHPVTAVVEGDNVKPLGERAAGLARPAQLAL